MHESFRLASGQPKKLKGEILHLTVDSTDEHRRMINERYAPLAALQMFERGRRTSPILLALAGPAAFVSTFLLKAGFLDGMAGLTIARYAAYHAFLKHSLLWNMQRGKS